jgi:hypothetical protein
MANEMTGLMDKINSGFKKHGLSTTRDGNNVTVTGSSNAGAGRGKQGGPTAKEMEYRNSEDYMSPDTENKLKEEKRFNKMSAESASQKYANGGMTASSRADGCCVKGKTRGKLV